MDNNNEGLRLQVYLARCGIGSRRKCEEFIAEGRVQVNGKFVLKPGRKVQDSDQVHFDGRPVRPSKELVYIAMHKPSGYICSNTDHSDRPLAKDLLGSSINYRLFNVGRLDYMTSGLLFFTNDGEFTKLMTHPSSHIEKEYTVTTKNEIPEELMEQFVKGIYVQGEFFKAKRYQYKGTRTVNIVLEEGKNKELRKVFLSKNISMKSIHRVRIGSVTLSGLTPGRFRKLNQKEVDALKSAAKEKKEKNKERGDKTPFNKNVGPRKKKSNPNRKKRTRL